MPAGTIEGCTRTMTALALALATSTGDLLPAIGRGLLPIAIVFPVEAAARRLRRPAGRFAG
ncbi:MAG TPA: hypothetical protein VGF60_08275 [Xanthobacteraceae bacterium]